MSYREPTNPSFEVWYDRFMLRWFLIWLVFAPVVTHAQAGPDPSVVRALSSYDRGPGASFWQQLDPDTIDVLVRLYDDDDQPPFIRLRAVVVARHFPSSTARTFLLRVARAPNQPGLMVREAVRSLSVAFGARASVDIQGFVGHRDRSVREAAVQALLTHRTTQGMNRLRERLAHETDVVLRTRIRRALLVD